MKWLPQWLGARDSDSDEVVMRRLQAHSDHAAFAELMRRWEAPIRRLCIRMTGDEHRGEDLSQETFSRVFAHRHQFDPQRRFATWLWRIALNVCYEDARRTSNRPLLRLSDEPFHDPHAQAVASEEVDRVRQAIAALPETHRAIVVLREYEQLKFREIAQVLDLPEGTVKWRMTEALDKLTEALQSLAPADEPRQLEDKRVKPKERLLL